MVSARRTCRAPERTSTADSPGVQAAAWRCGSITAPRRFRPSFALTLAGIERHGEELEAMLDEPVAQALGDVALQLFDLLVAELDDAAGAEIMARQDVGLLEKPYRAVDGGDADLGVDLIGPAVDRFDIWVIGRVR